MTEIPNRDNMQELIDRLKLQAGLTDDQAIKAIDVIKGFTKEKFPMFSGAIDKLFEKYDIQDKDDFLE
jgi:hypothetical protein